VKHTFTYEETLEALETGFDWKRRVNVVGGNLEWFLTEASPPGKVYRNTELTISLLKALGRSQPRSDPAFKPLSQFITQVGKLKDFRPFITPGPEMKTWVKGEMTWVRTRLWVAQGEAPAKHEQPYPDGRPTPDEVPQAFTFTAEELAAYIEREIAKALQAHKAASVEGVDTEKFSKHHSTGATAVTCASCDGTGKVWKRRDQ
jgi:hypothetical protein